MTELPSFQPADETAVGRVLIIGDSNIYPRRDDKYREMWVARLKRVMPGMDFIVLESGGRTTEFLALYPRKLSDGSVQYSPSSLEMFEPDLVIIQLGIVDCAPRYFRRFESKVIGNLPGLLRHPVLALAKAARRRSPARAYVSPAAFRANLSQYLGRCRAIGVRRVILIGIPSPDARGLAKNPGLGEAVRQYNEIYASLAAEFEFVVFVNPLIPEARQSRLFVEDGYHLSPQGHQVVFEAIRGHCVEHDST